MESLISIVTPNTKTYLFGMDQLQGNAILTTNTYLTVGITDSLIYVPLYTFLYTIDMQGILTIISMFFSITTLNDVNAVCKIQVSGNGGVTFIDITEDIGNSTSQNVSYAGKWLSTIDAGKNMFQIKILGKSTDGNPANIKIKRDSTGNITIHKHLI